ncbi:hypothetical protein BDN67DRAFT_1016074 [Paxillus ammoniavirescens]|nr:hypothetical protein BDN67DRAFT_1016074 [Paxillus ammoniavirescens]
MDRDLDSENKIAPASHKDSKSGPTKKKRGKKTSTHLKGDEAMGLKSAIKAIYNLSIFPVSEFKKDMKKQKGSNTYFTLDDDKPYDTWKAQLLVKINKKMSLTTLSCISIIIGNCVR